jgi:hypothetical protein
MTGIPQGKRGQAVEMEDLVRMIVTKGLRMTGESV